MKSPTHDWQPEIPDIASSLTPPVRSTDKANRESKPNTHNIMHYANGRPANNGDRVLRVGQKDCYQKPVIGILHDAVAGNNTCNGNLAAPIGDQGHCNLAECLHLDDVRALLGDITQVPDTSKAE